MKWDSARGASDRIGGGLSRMVLMVADDLHLMQEHTLAGYLEEAQETIEHVHDYGFTNVPQKKEKDSPHGAEAFLSFLNGNRSHGIALKVGDRRFRLFGLEPGEVALHDDIGSQLHLKKDGLWASAINKLKFVMQVMASDTLPTPPKLNPPKGSQQSEGSSDNKLGQGQQAGQANVALVHGDKNQVLGQFGGNDKAITIFKVDKDHAVIHHVKSEHSIWVDKDGCWSSQPIKVAKNPYKDKDKGV